MTTSLSSVAFDAITNAQTRVPVLGSLPGQRSLDERRYYAHPQNQFWRLMAGVVGIDLVSLGYRDRLDALLRSGIGLWDVIASAQRVGSLDSAIRAADHRDLRAMIATLPALRAVAFNGGTALRIGRKQLAEPTPVPLLALPSSSAAYTIGLAAKQPHWNEMRAYLA